ncbi:FG-GAP repeat protein [Nonomuraea solani]|nr:FG-GAP repeat protein [Nonomuraea solani]
MAALITATPAQAARQAKSGDFNGDGKVDLVISAEQETVGGFISAGLVIALDGVGAANAAAFDLGRFGATDPSFGSFGHALLP